MSILTTFYVATLYLFLYVPIIILVVFSFNTEPFPAPWSSFTLKWYRELWDAMQIWAALTNSIIVAVCATLLSILMAIALVYYMVHRSHAKRYVGLFYVNLTIPEIVLAVGLLSVFAGCSVPLGRMTLIVAHTVLGLGYTVPLIYAGYEALDHSLIEASLDLGASYRQTFLRVILPLLRPSILVAALLVFIISFDDFVLSYFCSGSTAQTLPLYILSMLRTGVSPVVNALSTGLLVLSGLLVIIFCYLAMKVRLL